MENFYLSSPFQFWTSFINVTKMSYFLFSFILGSKKVFLVREAPKKKRFSDFYQDSLISTCDKNENKCSFFRIACLGIRWVYSPPPTPPSFHITNTVKKKLRKYKRMDCYSKNVELLKLLIHIFIYEKKNRIFDINADHKILNATFLT